MSHQTHPFINIVCKTLDEIEGLLIDDPPRALLKLDHLLRIVDPEKRKEVNDYSPVSEEIKRHIKDRAAIRSASPEKFDRLKGEYDRKWYGNFVDLYDRAWCIMWACGYMFDATFRVEIKEDKPVGSP